MIRQETGLVELTSNRGILVRFVAKFVLLVIGVIVSGGIYSSLSGELYDPLEYAAMAPLVVLGATSLYGLWILPWIVYTGNRVQLWTDAVVFSGYFRKPATLRAEDVTRVVVERAENLRRPEFAKTMSWWKIEVSSSKGRQSLKLLIPFGEDASENREVRRWAENNGATFREE